MTIKLPITQELLIVASHVVWFKSPEDTLSNPIHFLAYLMTYGVHEDLKIVNKKMRHQELWIHVLGHIGM